MNPVFDDVFLGPSASPRTVCVDKNAALARRKPRRFNGGGEAFTTCAAERKNRGR